MEQNRVTPDFHQLGAAGQDVEALMGELIKSEDKVQALERQVIESKYQVDEMTKENA